MLWRPAHSGVSTSPLVSLEQSPVWHPYTAVPHQGPRDYLVRAQGAYVYTENGHRLFDATSSWWSCLHGHCHPELVEAIRQQAETLDQVLMAPHEHPAALGFAHDLLNAMGKPYSKVFFSDDGSTAVEAALKMARQYWFQKGEDRTHFLSVELGYHGDTLGAVAVGHLDDFHRAFSPVIPVYKSTAPYCYRCPLGLAYPECRVACLDSARKTIEQHGHKIAAFIVEPLVMGAGGFIFYPLEYLDALVELCRTKGILVIFDEVFTGFGRTGSMFALQDVKHKPDIVCLSKGLTSGMLALGATVTTEEVFGAFVGGEKKKFYHGHTFSGNAIACALGRESLRLLSQKKVWDHNLRLSGLMQGQTERFAALPAVGDVRARGMIWAMELVRDKTTREAFEPPNALGWRIATKAWEQGVWLRPMGSVLYVVPPYCSTEADLQHCFDVLYALTGGDHG